MKMYTTDCDFGSSAEGRLFATVWMDVTKEYLREFNYQAECANLNFDACVLHDNFNFTWSGFNDSMHNYINETIA
jgi:insulysin